MFFAQKALQLLLGLHLRQYPIANVGPIKPSYINLCPIHMQAFNDLTTGRGIGGGGQGQARHLGEALCQDGKPQIMGPKIVPPLGDAVSLIDGKQRHRQAGEKVQGALHQQPLRSHVEHIQLTTAGLLHNLVNLSTLQGGVDEGGPNAIETQGIDLILHQGDEGRNHHTNPMTQQRWNLIT